MPACRYRRRTRSPGASASTAAGRNNGSPSSSTATASTTRATRGSRTTSAGAKRVLAATSFGPTPGATSPKTRSPSSAISLPDEPQTGEGEEIVGLVDLVAERHDRARQPPGRDPRDLVAHLLAQPAHERIDLSGEAVDDARADRRHGRAPDQLARRLDLDRRKPRGPLGERLDRDLDAGREDRAEQLAVGGDDVVVDRGAEVDDDARAADAVVCRHRVHETVGPGLVWVLRADRDAGLHAGPDHLQRAPEVARTELGPLVRKLRDDR